MPNHSNSNNQAPQPCQAAQAWLVIEGVPGLTIAPRGTPLTRLHYFDGKVLRADALELEQTAQRRLVHLSNRAGGLGIVCGFDTRLLAADMLEVGPGQAIDGEGQVLLLPMAIEVSITDLIARSQQQPSPGSKPSISEPKGFFDCQLDTLAPTPDSVGEPGLLWLITVAHAEFLCGEEEVYAKLCQQACTASTERPYRVEGVVLRARPLPLSMLPSSNAVPLLGKHLRSRVASTYFADERACVGSLISGAGLRSGAWCMGADLAHAEVALGVLCRQGASNRWFDAWTARRERMDGPPRDYWAQRMAMRPWRDYLAQILQFQCQLAELLVGIVSAGGQPIDPCADDKTKVGKARDAVSDLLAHWAEAGIGNAGQLGALTIESLSALRDQLGQAPAKLDPTIGQRILIEGGIIELPPAGYLPVDPYSERSVNEQVRRLLGEGVDLRFCVVRPDDVARELEGAQHMDRISLLRGLDDPSKLPPVDVLVPEGRIVEASAQIEGLSFRAKLGVGQLPVGFAPKPKPGQGLSEALFVALAELADSTDLRLRGAARAARTLGGGAVAHIAALMQPKVMVGFNLAPLGVLGELPEAAAAMADKFAPANLEGVEYLPAEAPPQPSAMATWFDMSASADPFTIALGSALSVSFEVRGVFGDIEFEYRLVGQLQILERKPFEPGSINYGTLATGKLVGFESRKDFGGADASSASEYGVTLLDLSPSGSVDGLTISLAPVPGKALLDNDAVIAWNGQSLEVSGLWVYRNLDPFNLAQQPSQIVASSLAHDDAVLVASDPDHVAAVQALQLIANSIDDPSFAQQAAAKLFPPAPAPTDAFELQAVHDWVLFHARHRHECAPSQKPVVPVEQRRFQVYALAVEDGAQAKLVAAALRSDGDILNEFQFTPIGAVDYQAGVAALGTPADVITGLWKSQGEGRLLGWGGIASVGPAAAEGEAVARGRLLALEQVITKVSPKIPEYQSELLAKVPHVFAIGDSAGAIVLLTAGVEQREYRLSLFHVDPNAIELLMDVALDDVDHLLVVSESRHIAELQFGFDEREPISATIDEHHLIFEGPGRAFVFTHEGDELPAPDLLDKQVQAAGERAQMPPFSTVARRNFTKAWDPKWGRVIVLVVGNAQPD